MRARNLFWLATAVAIGVIVVTASRLNGLSTREAPTAFERALARAVQRWAIPRGARTAINPVAFSDEVWTEARAHFADHCASCHGNDGSGQTQIGQHLYPRAPDMRLAATQNLTDGELYWIIENGVRLTGMPAWGAGGGDDHDTCELVHFIRALGELTPEQLDEMKRVNPRSPVEIQEEIDDQ